jgi:hypothetical protein
MQVWISAFPRVEELVLEVQASESASLYCRDRVSCTPTERVRSLS